MTFDRVGWGALAATALLAVAAGCGSGGDKAGGGSQAKPVVLRLESEDDIRLSGAPEFAAAVARLSGGAVRVDLVRAGRSTEVDFERGVVEDVRDGKAQLGIVGVRVWDTMGVDSFRPLLAPFLVDSVELELRVLESPLADQMLDGVKHGGVVGVALLPGPLRRPFGITRALVSPSDYRGARIEVRPAALARRSLRVLGSDPRSYVPGDLAGADGAELDPATAVYNGLEQQRGWLTTNVVLWPKPYSIVMNRRAFDALTSAQQEVLRRAGREAAEPERRQIERDAALALEQACAAGKLTFVEASSGQLAALRTAVQPVYDVLARDPRTAHVVEEIAAMRREGPGSTPTVPRCHAAGAGAVSQTALDGTWKLNRPTTQELIDAGIDPKNAEALSRHVPGTPAFVFDRGRFKGIDLDTGKLLSTGTYHVDADIVRLVFESGAAVQFGRVYSLRWSIYRDSLTFAPRPGSEPLIALVLRPWKRVR